jgi:hypothetical protein
MESDTYNRSSYFQIGILNPQAVRVTHTLHGLQPTGILRAGLAARRKNLRPPQQLGRFYSKRRIRRLKYAAKPAQQPGEIPVG